MSEEGIMRKYISYDKLSGEIKDAIYLYWDTLKQGNPALKFDEAMEDWFMHQFDGFMIAKYHIRGDNLRKHFRLDVRFPYALLSFN